MALRVKKGKASPFRMKSVVRKMKSGYRVQQTREEEEMYAKNVKLVTKDGVQIPLGAMAAAGGAYPPYPSPGTGEVGEAPKIKIEEGIPIQVASVTSTLAGSPIGANEDEREELKSVNISYGVSIPGEQTPRGQPQAYASIVWGGQELDYKVIEPPISGADKEVIHKIKIDIEERLDIDFTKIGRIKAKEIIMKEIEKSFILYPEIDANKKTTLSYYIQRDLLGFGKIQVFMNDPNIEDISCDGVNVPIYVYHRDPKFGSIRTNVMFTDEDELNSFVMLLAQKCNKTLSIAEPLLDGALPDGSRIQATLGTDIARKGSNFTIRKFTEKPLTPTQLVKYGSADPLEFAYLWLAIENGMSILVSGGTATGKTSMLNAMALFIRPGLKVVSIEDTAELRLPLPHWVPQVARSPLSVKGHVGEVTLFDLLRTSLRQRPDYIIVGEVRGKEAFVLFQQIATGHPSLATIHAASIPQLIDRLVTPPISLPPSLIENLDLVVFLNRSRIGGSYVRRINNILEITGIKGDRPLSNTVFEWNPMTDKVSTKEKSIVLKKMARKLGVTEITIQQELLRRKKILEWMADEDITDYRDVADFIKLYYSDPERVIDLVDS